MAERSPLENVDHVQENRARISPATAAFGKVRIWAPVLVRWFGLRKFVRPTPSVAL